MRRVPHQVAGFTYDADTGRLEWYQASEVAERNGDRLAAFVEDYRERSDARIRVVCHSVGRKVTTSALEALANNGITDAIESVTLLGAAVHRDQWTRSGEYGPAVRAAAGQADEYYLLGDDTLQWAFGRAEGAGGVGGVGVDGEAVEN